MARSRIEWTEVTWNPVTVCSKISAGCKHCYAERMAHRMQSMGLQRYVRGFEVTVQEDLLDAPRRWRSPRLVFVNSMSDLFHEHVSLEIIQRIFATMNACPQHTFQALTKRSGRIREMAGMVHWTPNIWMGVSVENQRAITRIDDLRCVPAHVRFISREPLLELLGVLPLDGIHWVIVGGDSGPGARPMEGDWVRASRDQCAAHNDAFLSNGAGRKGKAGRELDGRTYDAMPMKIPIVACN